MAGRWAKMWRVLGVRSLVAGLTVGAGAQTGG